jgi:hypothetical protein
MKIPLGAGVSAQMTFNVTVKRNDAEGAMPTIVSLYRWSLSPLTDYRTRQDPNSYDMTGVPWPNGGWFFMPINDTFILLGSQDNVTLSSLIIETTGGQTTSVILPWYEDGVTSTLPANATWGIGAAVGIPSTAGDLYEDSDTGNNRIMLDPCTYNCTSVTATTQVAHGSTTYMKPYVITGDLNLDGRVDILDGIRMSRSFGKRAGEVGFNPAADLNNDGVVNIIDVIILAMNFDKKLGFLP